VHRFRTSTYRYKRPPRKRKPLAIEGPVIVTPADPKKGRRRREQAAAEDLGRNPPGDDQAGERQPSPTTTARKPAIVTVRSAGEDMTPENTRGDAADALLHEIVRRVAAACAPDGVC
jgi:hypothetical protein